jgi:hypothetical protein
MILDMPAHLLPLGAETAVAKVDRLMSLCDDLEAKLVRQEEPATRLAGSLSAAAVA